MCQSSNRILAHPPRESMTGFLIALEQTLSFYDEFGRCPESFETIFKEVKGLVAAYFSAYRDRKRTRSWVLLYQDMVFKLFENVITEGLEY